LSEFDLVNMSSHHIIRDDQEPALLILEADSSSKEIIGQWLEWSPSVMVTEKSIHLALALEIKIDVMLCPEQQVQSYTELLASQLPIRFIHAEDPLIAGLNHWKSRNVIVYSSNGNEEFEILKTLEAYQPNNRVVLLMPHAKWVQCANTSFIKHFSTLSRLTIWSQDDQVYKTNSKLLTLGNGIWLIDAAGMVEVSSSGSFWVKEPIF
jgi:hypothetical protein